MLVKIWSIKQERPGTNHSIWQSMDSAIQGRRILVLYSFQEAQVIGLLNLEMMTLRIYVVISSFSEIGTNCCKRRVAEEARNHAPPIPLRHIPHLDFLSNLPPNISQALGLCAICTSSSVVHVTLIWSTDLPDFHKIFWVPVETFLTQFLEYISSSLCSQSSIYKYKLNNFIYLHENFLIIFL